MPHPRSRLCKTTMVKALSKISKTHAIVYRNRTRTQPPCPHLPLKNPQRLTIPHHHHHHHLHNHLLPSQVPNHIPTPHRPHPEHRTAQSHHRCPHWKTGFRPPASSSRPRTWPQPLSPECTFTLPRHLQIQGRCFGSPRSQRRDSGCRWRDMERERERGRGIRALARFRAPRVRGGGRGRGWWLYR